MPVNFLSEAERLRLSRFPATISDNEIISYFTLAIEDLSQVKRQRQLYNRLGCALQLCTLRYLGFCPKVFSRDHSLGGLAS